MVETGKCKIVLTQCRNMNEVEGREVRDVLNGVDLENNAARTNKNKKKVHTIKNQSHIKKETIKIVSN